MWLNIQTGLLVPLVGFTGAPLYRLKRGPFERHVKRALKLRHLTKKDHPFYLSIYFERRWDQPIDDLRAELGLNLYKFDKLWENYTRVIREKLSLKRRTYFWSEPNWLYLRLRTTHTLDFWYGKRNWPYLLPYKKQSALTTECRRRYGHFNFWLFPKIRQFLQGPKL